MSIAQARLFRRSMSPPEARLWMALRDPLLRPHHFRRQVALGPYYADFASHSARLVIEVDGGAHFTDDALRRDGRRDAFIRAQGSRVLRFTSVDVFEHIDGVVTAILGALPQPPPTA
jgi:very-short-patch-repair endonuclease